MRPSRDEVYIQMAALIAERSTCARRKVGCILTDKNGKVLATGYNGVPSGFSHCSEQEEGSYVCKGANAKSGESLDACKAIHAEQNALLQCPDTSEIHTCYTTTQPCVHCSKLLLNTGCKRIVFLDKYTHFLAESMWLESGRELYQINANIMPERQKLSNNEDKAGAVQGGVTHYHLTTNKLHETVQKQGEARPTGTRANMPGYILSSYKNNELRRYADSLNITDPLTKELLARFKIYADDV